MTHGDESLAEDTRTRAEELRDRFQRRGKWVNEGGHEIILTMEQALNRVQTYQRSYDELVIAAAKTKAALDTAQKKHNDALRRLREQKDSLDVHKMILAEQMEIPS